MTLADGVEVHLEPGRAGLTPEQARALVRGITALYRQLRGEVAAAHDQQRTPDTPPRRTR
jgi:hypothetical protein